MVDSGNTHSFINPTSMHALSLSTVVSDKLTIITAGGTRLSTNKIYELQEF
jgi:hypothetical protein